MNTRNALKDKEERVCCVGRHSGDPYLQMGILEPSVVYGKYIRIHAVTTHTFEF